MIYKLEDLNMKPEELKKFLEGARKFVPIEQDPDDDLTIPKVDTAEQ